MPFRHALHFIEANQLARITNYSEFLATAAPELEVRIFEATSWSCAHGVERWRSDCGCHTGGLATWNQRWRGPLRSALDWLRDQVRPLFETAASELLHDPWAARDDYIDVLLNRDANLNPFLAHHARVELDEAQRVTVLKLLELQRHAMLMYTSCGWFFNDVSGIETIQVLQYAGRVVQLAHELFGLDLDPAFIELLDLAESNDPERGTAGRIYRENVQPDKLDLLRVAAHYAVDSVFAGEEAGSVYAYSVESDGRLRRASGDTQLIAGRARIISNVTLESEVVTYAVLHLGGHNLAGGIRRFAGEDAYQELMQQLVSAYEAADLSSVIRLLSNFPEYPFSLKSLFKDRQREVLYRLLQSSVRRAEEAYRRVYLENTPLTRFLVAQDLPLPRAFTLAAEFVVNHDIRAQFDAEDIDIELASELVADAAALKVPLDKEGLAYALKRTLERLASRLSEAPGDLHTLESLARAATLARSLPLSVDLWKVQNVYYDMLATVHRDQTVRAQAGAPDALRWVELFRTVGAQLEVAVT